MLIRTTLALVTLLAVAGCTDSNETAPMGVDRIPSGDAAGTMPDSAGQALNVARNASDAFDASREEGRAADACAEATTVRDAFATAGNTDETTRWTAVRDSACAAAEALDAQ